MVSAARSLWQSDNERVPCQPCNFVNVLQATVSTTSQQAENQLPLICRAKHLEGTSMVQRVQLRTFLGFASYYRCFADRFSKLTAPLHCLVAELWTKDL